MEFYPGISPWTVDREYIKKERRADRPALADCRPLKKLVGGR